LPPAVFASRATVSLVRSIREDRAVERKSEEESPSRSQHYTHFMRQIILLIALATSLLAADTTYDGSRVHYENYGRGSDAVIFIHGWTCDHTFWQRQASIYEKYRALLVDLPGHGQSEKPNVGL
jgi:hypothetical protein